MQPFCIYTSQHITATSAMQLVSMKTSSTKRLVLACRYRRVYVLQSKPASRMIKYLLFLFALTVSSILQGQNQKPGDPTMHHRVAGEPAVLQAERAKAIIDTHIVSMTKEISAD